MAVMRRWKRIEPGYYALQGTPYEIANMKGQSVKYSGPMADPWQLRRVPSAKDRRAGALSRTLGWYPTMVAAKQAAVASVTADTQNERGNEGIPGWQD